jgi:2'-5' RNA ligase
MRVFIAVELPAAAVAAAASASQQLREEIARHGPRARLTWVPPDRMHVTLRFLGEVEAGLATSVAAVMAPSFETPRFTLTLGNPGVFPARGAPRTCWLSIVTGLDSLRALAGEASSRLLALAIPPEPRPFAPHVTLARVREAGGLRGTAWLAGATVASDAGGIVDAITLFESRLSSTGPTYTALQRTPLAREVMRAD